jgi:hypothetical protein
MSQSTQHTYIPELPHLEETLGAQMEACFEEMIARGRDLVVDFLALHPASQPEILLRDGRLWERVVGEHVPRRMRFSGVRWLRREGVFADLASLPPGHPARALRGVLSWRPAEQAGLFSLFLHGADDADTLMLVSRDCRTEGRAGESIPVEVVRDWSPAPLFRPGLVPRPAGLHRLYGGDPVRIRLDGKLLTRRLFVGDLECQPAQRPAVGAVLNVGEEPSRWVGEATLHPTDRWVTRGEGALGMTPEALREEAGWVLERLRAGQRVLVHCVAGLNRSTSVACAALILAEGLSAVEALARVRERHRWARPDGHHWLALQWLGR